MARGDAAEERREQVHGRVGETDLPDAHAPAREEIPDRPVGRDHRVGDREGKLGQREEEEAGPDVRERRLVETREREAEAVERVEATSFPTRVRLYISEVIAEMRRVTWPDKAQVRQLSIGVVVLSLVIGGVIAIIDLVLQNVLVRWIPSLFGAG